MSRFLIAAIGLAYAYVSLEMELKGNHGMSIMYAGYAIGNVGLWLMAE